MKKYPKNEINEFFEKVTQKCTECDALPLQELVRLLDEGWIIYDTRTTDDEDIKILTLAKIT